ncbi:MAG: tRNA preQ1(34) S-adenosylmethionine ribosyltransferase-isomerase QueA [Planctomycetes bacterium HGW-Planctomycetes-1]|nr:MAG: tRNA preQ1(34) S-adenosylmethionine ribosyltransferase-isomerase QueA [Planctomycetes bacterium HGW-Planctomycetes-1]
MEIEKLNYDLPPELIAQKPAPNRAGSRMLVLDRSADSLLDSGFSQIVSFINKGDCFVINNTKVLPARFFAQKSTGAKIEGLFIAAENNNWLVMLKNSSRLKQGETLNLLDRNKKTFCTAVIDTKLEQGQWLIKPALSLPSMRILETIGFAPLPPYIKRPDPASEHQLDTNRYQTVYAAQNGAIAAPTAGLHFTPEILEQIKAKGISIAQITLHVGQGTFLPVKTKTLEEHKIHSEEYFIDAENAQIINKTIQSKGRIFAVGTTAVRTLETVAEKYGKIIAAQGRTELFITPGFEFKITDAMLTNFHLPKSTLLALVAAFAGLDKILAAYKHAVDEKYRFYSYGDCMLIL